MAAEQTIAAPSSATVPPGLPDGVLELAARTWWRAEQWIEVAGLQPTVSDRAEVERRVVEELTAPLRLEDWPAPTEPRPVVGGWIHDEVIDDDRRLFEAIVAGRAAEGPESVAEAAQQVRLPVTPYRPLPTGRPPEPASSPPPIPTESTVRRSQRPLVVDLSTHWAGPLSTALLAQAGARVIKIDPGCRPDGFRARPTLYRHLNRAKEIVDLDLRHPDDRAHFEGLLDRADLIVESFSRRVLPNLGYGPPQLRQRWPRLAVISIKAFPARRPEADWLAYGPGVHAASGLGLLDDRARPAPIAYADVLAGLRAFERAVGFLATDRRPERQDLWIETTLFDAITPLVDLAIESGVRRAGVDR